MNQKPIAVLISGYARAGKTSIISELGHNVYSTSKYLDLVCSGMLVGSELQNSTDWPELYRTVELNHKYVKDFQSKNENIAPPGYTIRSFKIMVAEDIIVPLYGRERGLIIPTLWVVDYNAPVIYIETIGGEEAECIKNHLPNHKIIPINIRSKGEQAGVDIRQLLPDARDIYWSQERWYHVEKAKRDDYRKAFINSMVVDAGYDRFSSSDLDHRPSESFMIY